MVTIDLGLDRVATKDFWRAVFAEFFGCMLFLLCVTSVALPWGNAPDNISANNVEIGIGIGLAIASLAQAFGHVSGGHLNPAVSLGMIVGGRINIIQGVLYIIAQTIGGVVGSALTKACTPENQRGSLGATTVTPGVAVEQGFGMELLFTFILVFFVFSITDPAKNTEPYGTTLGIGVVIWVCHVCLIPYTGCGINPARSFGPCAVMGIWENHWIYWIGPLLGGSLAALIYNVFFYVKVESYTATKKDDDVELAAES